MMVLPQKVVTRVKFEYIVRLEGSILVWVPLCIHLIPAFATRFTVGELPDILLQGFLETRRTATIPKGFCGGYSRLPGEFWRREASDR